MRMQLYTVSLFSAIIISLLISVLSWKRRPSSGSVSLALLMAVVAEWILAQTLQESVDNIQQKILFDYFKFIGVSAVPVLWLILTLEYTKRERFLNKCFIISISILPFITNVIIFTNQYHGLFYKDYSLKIRGGILFLDSTKNIWFWIHTTYSYILIFFAIVILISAFINLPNIYRKQTGLLLTGGFIALMGNIPTTFNLLYLPISDTTPIALLFTGLLYFWALFRYKFLDLVPIARHTIIENMNDLVIVLDNQGRIVDINPAAINAIGKKSSKILGQHISQVMSEYAKLIEKFKDTLYTNEKLELHKGDVKKCYDFRISPIYDRKSILTGLLIMLRDITELEEAMTELKKSREAAEAANKAKSQFLANMSHEIRTPMNAVIGMSDLLSSTVMSNEQQTYLDTIRNSAESLLTIINDILDFSKIEAGKLELEKIEFNITKLIDSTIDALSFQASNKGLILEYFIEEGIPHMLMGDPIRLKQILINLISNSIKFTLKGTVKVNLQVLKNDSSHVLLKFSVTDTGIGIAEDKIIKLFESFNQLDNSHTRKFGGTGLGLTIAKNLVEMMGGHIKVESVINKGSTFFFEVPFQVSSKQCITGHSSQSIIENSQIGKKVHILLAEDNKTNQLLMISMLKKSGYLVEVADNGKIAVEKFKAGHYDLILMDIQMPEMDGFEASSMIREIEKGTGKHIPIIALTANAMKGDRENCIESGMDDYLSKPIKSQVLKDTLVRLRNNN